MLDTKWGLQIVSWSVTVTTMEDIFFKATKSNEMEKSSSDPSDESICKSPYLLARLLLYFIGSASAEQ